MHKSSPKPTMKKAAKERGNLKGKAGSARNSPPSDLGFVPEENEEE